MVFLLNEHEYSSFKDALCQLQVWFSGSGEDVINVFSLLNVSPLGKGRGPSFEEI